MAIFVEAFFQKKIGEVLDPNQLPNGEFEIMKKLHFKIFNQGIHQGYSKQNDLVQDYRGWGTV